MPSASDPDGTGERLLTLQQAADILHVHYMTAYRWVRKATLPAFKAGGRLRIRTEDLDRFVAEREIDVAMGVRRGRTDWPTHVGRLHRLLGEGKGVEAASMVRKVVSDGAPAGRVYFELLAPTLHRIGDDWAAGRITVAEEHRATEIVSAIMARLGEFFRRRGPRRGAAITMTPPDELHALGALMAADFLRAAGYHVDHLGPNVPLDDLRTFLEIARSDVICVSVTNRDTDPAVLGVIAEVASGAGSSVVVGGQGAAPAAIRRAGAVYVPKLGDLASCVDQLVSA